MTLQARKVSETFQKQAPGAQLLGLAKSFIREQTVGNVLGKFPKDANTVEIQTVQQQNYLWKFW